MPRSRILTLAVALTALGAVAASAEIYNIRLHSGATFDTRYKPEVASWDAGLMMFMSDQGNWVALSRADVAAVTSETETQGFGTMIGIHTVLLGIAANDAPVDTGEPADPQARLLQLMEQQIQQGQQQPYSVEQFAEPTAAGGIPMWMTNTVTPPIGDVGTPPLSGAEPDNR